MVPSLYPDSEMTGRKKKRPVRQVGTLTLRAAELQPGDTFQRHTKKARWQRAVRERRGSAEAAAERAEVLVRINALRQEAARGKLDAIEEGTRNFLDGGEKLVIFAWHREIQDALAERLADFEPARITGGKGAANGEGVNR